MNFTPLPEGCKESIFSQKVETLVYFSPLIVGYLVWYWIRNKK